MASETLLRLLRERQGGLSQRAFARELGISDTLLSLVRAGKMRFGSRAAGRIAARYPDLRPLLGDALVGLGTPAAPDVTVPNAEKEAS